MMAGYILVFVDGMADVGGRAGVVGCDVIG